MSTFLEGPSHTRIDYLGAGLKAGPLPAFIYFALSGEESLTLHPYHQPALFVAEAALRVFSFTIPGHEPGMNMFHAMHYWAEQMAKGDYLLEGFFDKVTQAIDWLIGQHLINPASLAAGGLSRGGFVATHIASRVKQIHTLLGFAPLTELMLLKEFSENPALRRHASELDLLNLTEELTHVRNLRFYIGNLDTRVGTDACYRFIRQLAEKGHEKQVRHQKIELMITQSIGHKGHGTNPHIFEEGALWVKQLLLGTKL